MTSTTCTGTCLRLVRQKMPPGWQERESRPCSLQKTREDFAKAKVNVKKRYTNHFQANKAVLQNFWLKTELIPNPRKYWSLPDQRPPTNRETLVKEQILTFEQYLSSLNVFKCSLCLECKIEEKPYVEDPNYVCKGCKTRKDQQ